MYWRNFLSWSSPFLVHIRSDTVLLLIDSTICRPNERPNDRPSEFEGTNERRRNEQMKDRSVFSDNALQYCDFWASVYTEYCCKKKIIQIESNTLQRCPIVLTTCIYLWNIFSGRTRTFWRTPWRLTNDERSLTDIRTVLEGKTASTSFSLFKKE